MIPNEGGNQFSGNMFAGGTPGAWQADNLNPRMQDLGVQETPKVSLIYDFNGSFGGPLLRDRLWFFSSARRNVIDDGVLNSFTREGDAALDRNSITSANARLTWQINSQNKISAMFDKVRKRRFSEHQPNDDFETAAQSWTSPHYDTGTAKWTGTLSNRMLAEFGFSLVYEDWDPGYYRFSSVGDYDYFSQTKPEGAELAACFETPCYDAPGSTAYMAQTAPWSPGSPTWFNMAPRWDAHLGMNYHVADDDEQNNYSHRWAYQGAVSYVTGSHSFKVGTNFSYGQNRHTRSGNADLQQRYDDSPNLVGPHARLRQRRALGERGERRGGPARRHDRGGRVRQRQELPRVPRLQPRLQRGHLCAGLVDHRPADPQLRPAGRLVAGVDSRDPEGPGAVHAGDHPGRPGLVRAARLGSRLLAAFQPGL